MYKRQLLGCRRRGNSLSIEVWDTGIGIAQDKLVEIFQEFKRGDNVQRKQDRGPVSYTHLEGADRPIDDSYFPDPSEDEEEDEPETLSLIHISSFSGRKSGAQER